MGKTYFISDTHFGHFNILKYEPIRLEVTIEYVLSKKLVNLTKEQLVDLFNVACETKDEALKKQWNEWHNAMVISKWNSVIKNDDVVWFLGDFAFSNKVAQECGRKLNGIKRMIMGNHDREKPEFYYTCGFTYVSPYPIMLKKFFILSHAPLEYMNDKCPFFNIYGHVHSNKVYQTTTEYSQCVCIERQNFEPITIGVFDSL